MAVDDVERVGAPVDGVIVARVLRPAATPTPTRSTSSTSTPATARRCRSCCGAFNMAAGDLVPLATLGTTMPERHGDRSPQDARRVVERHAVLGARARPRRRPRRHPDPAARPRRSARPVFDALGHHARRRVRPRHHPQPARRLVAPGRGPRPGRPASACPSPTRRPAIAPAVARERGAPVVIDAPDLCGRFTVHRAHRRAASAPSAAWMAERLTPRRHAPHQQRGRRVELRDARAGPAQPPLRPGQAARRRLPGAPGPAPGETLVTLDDVTRALTSDDLLICDALDGPVGIAGIMGGAVVGDRRRHHRGGAGDGVVRARSPSPPPRPASACARRPRPASSVASTPWWPTAPSPASSSYCARRRPMSPSRPAPSTSGATCPCRPSIDVRTERVNALLRTELTDGRHRRADRADRLSRWTASTGHGAVVAARLHAPRSTSSRRWPATTATSASARRCRRRRTRPA